MNSPTYPSLHNLPFPKHRLPLPEAYSRIYGEWMRKNRMGLTQTTSLSTKLEHWMHRQVARDANRSEQPERLVTMELGAGTGNHLAFEPRSIAYDVVEPMDELYQSAPTHRIRKRFLDQGEIRGEGIYDRVISIAVLEHIEDLPTMLKQSHKLLRKGGRFRAGIPSEGGWLWRQAWRNTTSKTFHHLYGLDYATLMAYEHVNTAQEIRREVEKVFGNCRTRYFGLGQHLSFYQFVEAHKL